MKTKVTANDIRLAMRKRWTAPEWAIMWEVGEGTGSRSGRFADAVMMSLWPSRGLELHGVEIKVSRSDWKREAADPSKAEAVARYCDRWWIHTAPGVVDDLSDLPPAWGLREFDGKSWKTVREAEKTSSEAVTRTFLAALLRRADNMMDMMIAEATKEARERAYEEGERIRNSWDQRLKEAVDKRTKSISEQAENVRIFERSFGKAVSSWDTDYSKIGKAARVLAGCANSYLPLVKRLRDAADEIEVIESLNIATDPLSDL